MTLDVTLAGLGGGAPCGELACGSAAVLRCPMPAALIASPAIPARKKRRLLEPNLLIYQTLLNREIRRAHDRLATRGINRLDLRAVYAGIQVL